MKDYTPRYISMTIKGKRKILEATKKKKSLKSGLKTTKKNYS